ncbi:MAG: trypsin-like peptidase domain-containing protein [Candidatus Omnitrophica bacterium]|nr:trypsin-like peptidase domain-containing protein [Candidatus Omnitrophota bacterium]
MKKKLILLMSILVSFSAYTQDNFGLENAITEMVSNIGESVVSVSAIIKAKAAGGISLTGTIEELENDQSRGFFKEVFMDISDKTNRRVILGTGMIIDKEGHILTNEHILKGVAIIKVNLLDGREFDAEIKGVDARSDVAIIKINGDNFSAVKFGSSEDLKVGQIVVSLGNPFGPYTGKINPVVSLGVISSLYRSLPVLKKRKADYNNLIQTDAVINPSNSGGPLVNLDGEVVGINTAISFENGYSQGLGFAVPIDTVKDNLNKLIKGEEIVYGWLGVNAQDLNDDFRNYFGIQGSEGSVVLKVYKNSPAEKSGFKEGDLILSFDNQIVRRTQDLIKIVSLTKTDKPVLVNIVRGGNPMVLRVDIGNSFEEKKDVIKPKKRNEIEFRGMFVKNMNIADKQKNNLEIEKINDGKGVVIVDIEPGSLAQRSGFGKGDIILKIENKDIINKESFKTITSQMKTSCLVKTNKGYLVLKIEEDFE